MIKKDHSVWETQELVCNGPTEMAPKNSKSLKNAGFEVLKTVLMKNQTSLDVKLYFSVYRYRRFKTLQFLHLQGQESFF